MNLKSRSIIITVIAVLAFSLIFSACATTNRGVQEPGPTPAPGQTQNLTGESPRNATPMNMGGRTTNPPGADMLSAPGQPNTAGQQNNQGQPNTAAPQQLEQDNRVRSEQITNQLKQMRELNNANCVVMGDTALVGYNGSYAAKDVNATKDMIANKVKQIDPAIENVVVSESTNIMNRVNKLYNNMRGNTPANQVTSEFNNIVKSIAPKIDIG